VLSAQAFSFGLFRKARNRREWSVQAFGIQAGLGLLEAAGMPPRPRENRGFANIPANAVQHGEDKRNGRAIGRYPPIPATARRRQFLWRKSNLPLHSSLRATRKKI
jgi:hypothetical protein